MDRVTGDSIIIDRTEPGIDRTEPGTSRAGLVSVVIPTLDRPQLLLRALKSVFNQTYQNLDVIVVVDRPHEETDAVLREIDDPRLHVVVSPCPLSSPAARNLGVDEAKGAWVAFLDDDDEWLPTKIEKQLAFAAGREDVLVSCLSRVVTPRMSYVLPAVIYDNSVPLDDYLFSRSSPFARQGFIQTSSFFMQRSVLDRVRFRDDPTHDDWEFALRLSKQSGMRIETVPEVLTVLYFEEQRSSGTSRQTWKKSLAWIDLMRPIITPRAYGCFCLSTVGANAANAHAYEAFTLLLRRAFKYGSPSAWRVATFVALWLVPAGSYRRLRNGWRRLVR